VDRAHPAGMPRVGNHELRVGRVHRLTGEGALEQRIETLLAQVWERVERVRADDLVSAEAGDLLHEPVPHLVAEVAVIDDDTLTDAADDGTREMLRLHQPPLRALAVGDIADDALIADD